MTNGSVDARSSRVGSLGSLVVRSSSNGSLQQNQLGLGLGLGLQQQVNQLISSKKVGGSKMFVNNKDKDINNNNNNINNAFIWIFKFVPRKKVGMLLLSLASFAAMLWILYIAKGEINQWNSTSSPSADERRNPEIISASMNDQMRVTLYNDKRVVSHSPPLPPVTVAYAPPPPAYFTGYTLPPGNPCESFKMPPPPADKKKTGPRPCPVCYLPVEDAIALMPKLPSYSPVLHNLTYIHDESFIKSEFGGSDFGGYPSLKQRYEAYDIKESMAVHCGYDYVMMFFRFTGHPSSKGWLDVRFETDYVTSNIKKHITS